MCSIQYPPFPALLRRRQPNGYIPRTVLRLRILRVLRLDILAGISVHGPVYIFMGVLDFSEEQDGQPALRVL